MSASCPGKWYPLRSPGVFDAALNSINSIGYLHSDDEIVSHLRATGSSLRQNGIYIVHLNFAHEGVLPDGDHWTLERGGIRVSNVVENSRRRPSIRIESPGLLV